MTAELVARIADVLHGVREFGSEPAEVIRDAARAVAETLEADYVIEARPADPGPPCLNHYAGDMVCGQPAGHPVDVAKPDTWHRYGTVRWC